MITSSDRRRTTVPWTSAGIKTGGRLLFSLGAIGVVIHRLADHHLLDRVQTLDFSKLAGALLLLFISKWLSARRYGWLLHQAGIDLTEAANLSLYWQGMFYNQLLPGGIGGDGYKVWQLHRQTGNTIRLLATLTLLDRLVGLLPILVMGLLLGWSIFGPPGLIGWLVVASLGGVLYGLSSWLLTRSYGWTLCRQGAIHGYSLGVQLCQCLMTLGFVWAMNLLELSEPFLLLFLASSIGTVLPFSLGGIGVRELVFSVGATYTGISPDAAVLVGFLVYLSSVVVALPGGVSYLTTNGVDKRLSGN